MVDRPPWHDIPVVMVGRDLAALTDLTSSLENLGCRIDHLLTSKEEKLTAAAASQPSIIFVSSDFIKQISGPVWSEFIQDNPGCGPIYVLDPWDLDDLATQAFPGPFAILVRPVTEAKIKLALTSAVSSARRAVEYRQLESRMKESDDRLEVISRLNFDYVYSFKVHADDQISLEWMTEAYAKILGYQPEEMEAGKLWMKNVHPEDLPSTMVALKRILAGKLDFHEYRVIDKQGHIHWFQTHIAAIHDEVTGRIVRIIGASKEITDRKTTEAAMTDTQERYRILVETMRDGLDIFDQQGRFAYVNQRFGEITGYSPQELIGRHHAEFLDEENRRLMAEQIDRRRQGIEESYEISWTRKDGTQVATLMSPKALQDSQGNYVGSFAIVTDITERKRAEKALQESEQRYRSVVEISPDAIVIHRNTRVIYVNPAACHLLGASGPELLLGRPVFDLIHEDTRELALSRLHLLESGGHIVPLVEQKYVQLDGKPIMVEVSSASIQIDGQAAILTMVRDITKKKQAEEELRASEERYRALIQNIPFGLYRSTPGPQGRFIMANPAAVSMFGYDSVEDLLGRSVADLYQDPADRTKLWADHTESNRICAEVLHLKKKDGTPILGSITAVAARAPNGEILFVDGVIEDVTERQRQAEEKTLWEDRLRQAQKMEAIGTLAGGIAHDFNNLLMGVLGRLSLMLATIDSAHPHYEHLRAMEDYVTSATNLTSQLLGFTRGGKYEVKPCDLNRLLSRTADMFGRTRKEIIIHYQLGENLWPVEADQNQIEQVCLNLFINAWQAMPAGGDLYIKTENVILDTNYLETTGISAGRFVKISVTDTGIGMDEYTRQRIFEPFFSTKGFGRGTGLGLATAYGIIRNHGGFINVYTEKGLGSTFTIYLPVTDRDILEESEAARELVHGEETILIVDDEVVVMEVGRDMLEALGYQVLVANNGREAIEICEQYGPGLDLVILDLVMPDLGGSQTFDRLKSINPDIKVLLSSGYSLNGQAASVLQRGCKGFLQKPFNLHELSAQIRKALDS